MALDTLRPSDASSETADPKGSAVLSQFAHVRLRQRARATSVTLVLAAIVFALFVGTMMIGSYGMTPWEVISSTFGFSADPGIDYVIHEVRLPTAATALGVGLAMGLAGIIFQRLLANPLASPDFVGVASGAGMFAIVAIVILGLSGLAVSGAALAGAVTAAVLVYLLAWRDGVTGYRFILIGIGLNQFFIAGTGYVLSRSTEYNAREAMTWLIGGVGQAGEVELQLLLVTLAIVLPVVFVLTRQLSTIELGDDTATALGVRVELMRVALMITAVLLVGFATATAGPMAFVALIAGPIASRLVGAGSSALLAAAFVGAIIVLAADLVAVHALPSQLPTGVVTGAIGAPYLLWLLITVNREGRGG